MDLQDSVSTQKEEVAHLITASCNLEIRTEDTENWAWWINLQFVGFPEGSTPESFIEKCMLLLVLKGHLSLCFVVERVYRSLAVPLQKEHPRPMTWTILNYKDRDVVLRFTRKLTLTNFQSYQSWSSPIALAFCSVNSNPFKL
ncbi:hypothetical protein NDU88_004335 [Pleurodeles waltl]|uniref:Uncharacterized protein n=1 Tax=Pleurodeles waltl TaxID=8319 RepID=A0AAV7MX68_PLEWA|nr:hypothetical protein NDU88_004335 [Pleurodeles waltl]